MPQPSQNQTNLIKMLGIQDLPDEEKLRVIDQATYVVNMRVLERVANKLTESQLAEVEQKMEADDPQVVFDYLREHVDSIDEIINEEIQKVRKELFSLKEKAKEQVQDEIDQLEQQEW